MTFVRALFRRLHRTTIVTRVTMVATVCMGLAVVASEQFTYRTFGEMLRENSVATLQGVATRQADWLNAAISHVRSEATTLSRADSVQGFLMARETQEDTDERRRQLEHRFSVLVETHGFRMLRLIAADGRGTELVRVEEGIDAEEHARVVPPDLRGGSDSPRFAHLAAEMKPGEVQVSSIGLGRRDGVIEIPWRPTQQFVAAVFTGGSETGPSVALIVIDTHAERSLAAFEAEERFDVRLVNERGGMIYHPDPARRWGFEFGRNDGFDQERAEIWSRLLAGATEPVWDEDTGDVYVAKSIPLNADEGTSLCLMMTARGEGVASTLAGSRNRSAKVVILATLATLVLCAIALRFLPRRIGKLTREAERLAAGDEAASLTVGGTDEIGRLGRAFADLVTMLQARTEESGAKADEIANLNESLEDQVRERTSALARSEARVRAIVDSNEDAIITIDSRGLIASWNPAATRLLGFDRDEAIGESIELLIPEEQIEGHRRGFARYLETLEPMLIGRPTEIAALRKDGQSVPVTLTISEAVVEGERLFTGIVRDLTEAQMIRAELDQARKLEAIGHLASGIAHEINTPTQYVSDNIKFIAEASADLIEVACSLHAILKSEDLKVSEVPGLADLAEVLENADLNFLVEEVPGAIEHSRQGLASISEIVKAMKEFSHPGSATLGDVELNRNIESTAVVARNTWKYSADLELDLDPELGRVPCLEGEFNQVILNLIVNAAHAIEEWQKNDGDNTKGRITITTRRYEERAEVRVEDTGCGIPESLRSKIFDPFFTTKDVGKGTGQGLAIARAVIVDRLRGSLVVESEVGVGTTFIIQLALEPLELAASTD